MEAKDLMIGNWICVNGINSKVYDIAYNEQEKEITIGILDPQGEIYHCFYGYDHIEPISLTDEILNKNFGSRTFYDNEFIVNEWFTNGINVEKLADEMYYWVAQSNFDGIMQIKYVHQLQQILKLLNIDIEFKL